MKKLTLIFGTLLIIMLCLTGCDQSRYVLAPYEHQQLSALQEGLTEQEIAAYDEIIVTEVAVVGSDPEGVSAAVSAARNGMDVKLIDCQRSTVGGLYTLGWLNMIDLNYTKKGSRKSINQGIFAEILKANDNKSAFTIEKMEQILTDLLQQAQVDVVTDYDNWQVLMKGDHLDGLVLQRAGKTILLKAATFIDCTQNADLARAAGAKYDDGQAELNLPDTYSCSTLVFKLGGVPWKTIERQLQKDDDPNTGADDFSAWGYDDIKNCPIFNINIAVREFNIGLQEDGTILLNGLLVFNLDFHDPENMAEMRQQVIETLAKQIVPYMRDNFTGWENVYLVDVAPEFYIRESYHIKTMQRLTAADIYQSNFPASYIATGSYPIDLQASSKGLSGISLYGVSPYGIPYGAMVSEQISNLLIASRCSGYDALAAGSARTVPVGMSLGQAAGVAAAYAITNNQQDYRLTVPDLAAIENIRDLLNAQGAKLSVSQPTKQQQAVVASPYYPGIAYLRDRGMLACGYSNDYHLSEPATRAELSSICYAIYCNSPYQIPLIPIDLLDTGAAITTNNLLPIINLFLNNEETSLTSLKERGVLSAKTVQDLSPQRQITNELLYQIIEEVMQYMEQNGKTYWRDEYK